MEGDFLVNAVGRVPLIRDLDSSIFLHVAGTLAQAVIDDAPVLPQSPIRVDQVCGDTEGGAFYVPVVSLARRSASSATPSVFIGKSGDIWQLRITLDLRRHPSIPADASPLPVDDLRLVFTTSVPGVSVTFTEMLEEPNTDPEVVRRVVAVAQLDDPHRMAAVLQDDRTAALTVRGTVHSRLPLPDEPEPEPEGNSAIVVPPIYHRVEQNLKIPNPLRDRFGLVRDALRLDPTPNQSVPVADRRVLSRDVLRLQPVIQPMMFRTPAQLFVEAAQEQTRSEPRKTDLSLIVDQKGISMWFPTSVHANRPIYAMVNGAIGFDPDTVWITGPSGPWKASPIPNQYYVLPTEYRLAFDPARRVPSVTVLLREQPVAPGQPASAAYRVRVRFALVPWFAPEPLERLRTTIAEAEVLAYPEFVVGGYESAAFHPSSLFTDLGGDVVGQPAGSAIDARGFELVYDCSLEFYTLLCRMLAPGQGAAPGLEASVRVTLKTSPEDAGTVREIPVRIRLDAPSDEFLEVGPDPAGALSARVRNLAAGPASVRQAVATLLVTAQAGQQPIDAVAVDVSPLPFTVPAGGEITVSLTPREQVDPRVVGGLALDFDGVELAVPAETVLERVHELAVSVNLTTTVRVRSFQLQYAADLPPGLADLEGLEVQLRRGGTDPVVVFLTRQEWDKRVNLAYTLTDLVAGMAPDAPRFEWRRRNLTRTGTGEFSAWEPMASGDLFATPAV